MRQSIINKLNSNSMSKKVIEQYDSSKIEIQPYGNDFILVMQDEDTVSVANSSCTTVAKAICPEYQKVIDQNAELKNKHHMFIGAVSEFLTTEVIMKILTEINQALQNTKNIEG